MIQMAKRNINNLGRFEEILESQWQDLQMSITEADNKKQENELPPDNKLTLNCMRNRITNEIAEHGLIKLVQLMGSSFQLQVAVFVSANNVSDLFEQTANDLADVPRPLLKMQCLQTLVLARNKIEGVFDLQGMLKCLPQLELFDLSQNNVVALADAKDTTVFEHASLKR